jgi:hypothetical protein
MDIHIHIHIRRWVLWWFYVGLALGVIAISNVLGRDLTRQQDHVILAMGVIHWVLGGLVCYAFDSVRIERTSQPPAQRPVPKVEPGNEWHSPSDFVFPGGRKSVLPPKY